MTLTSSTAITIADNKISSVSCPALPGAGLAPNATLTCTASYTITQTDLDAGSVANTATATATDGATVTNSNATSATVSAVQAPALSLVKSTSTTAFAAVGVSVPYSFAVKNIGNVTINTAITVTDTKIAAVTCPTLSGGLAPGVTTTCTGSYTTTQADIDAGSVQNTATAKSARPRRPPRRTICQQHRPAR